MMMPGLFFLLTSLLDPEFPIKMTDKNFKNFYTTSFPSMPLNGIASSLDANQNYPISSKYIQVRYLMLISD